MINRNNKFKSFNKLELKGKKGRSILIRVAGLLLTATMLTGCGGKKETEYLFEYGTTIENDSVEVFYDTVAELDMSSFSSNLKKVDINGSDLTDVSELANYKKLETVDISDNLITDVSALESLPNLKSLNISNNSISNLNIENFKSLKSISIAGNYSLYSEEFISYCEENEIEIDITIEDVKDVEDVKGVLETLDLDGKTDLQKEAIIYDYIVKHMEYDYDALKDNALAEKYNKDLLDYALQGKGVCANYSAYFDAMCKLSGINCYQLHGFGHKEHHGWNLVEIDGQYMLCDVTWGDPTVQTQFGEIQTVNDIYANLYKNQFYNVTGKDAEKFIKEHEEAFALDGVDYKDVPKASVKSDLALSSDKNAIHKAVSENVVETNTEEVLQENNTEEYSNDMFSNVKDYINLNTSNVDKEQMAKFIMMGVATGSVVLLSASTKKRFDKKIKELKERKKNKEIEKIEQEKYERKLKEEKIKRDRMLKSIEDMKAKRNAIIKERPVEKTVEKPKEIKQVKKVETKSFEDNRFIEEKIASLKSNDEIRVFLENEKTRLLDEATELEINNRIDFDKNIRPVSKEEIEDFKKINKIFLINNLNNSKEQRALNRCIRDVKGFTGKSLDGLKAYEMDAINATIRVSRDVDKKLEEYKRAEELLNKLNMSSVYSNKATEKKNIIDSMLKAMEEGRLGPNGEEIDPSDMDMSSVVKGI